MVIVWNIEKYGVDSKMTNIISMVEKNRFRLKKWSLYGHS